MYLQTIPVGPDTLAQPITQEVVPGEPGRRWLDAGFSASAVRGSVGIFLSLLGRVGTPGMESGLWATGGAWASLSRQLVLQASVGKQPGAPELGTEAASVASLGFRFSRATPARAVPVRPADGTGAVVTRIDDHLVQVALEIQARQTVELLADFSRWKSLPMTETSPGRWRLVVPLQPGSYRINIRVDDSDWIAPPGLPTVTDEFGGIAGLLTVP
jgi:hypothetical protein